MPARLHHERIVRSDQTPARWLIMTHGIYGAGSNWRSIARKVIERRPEWGVVLVDLRQHGKSEAGEPPHTIAASADDLRALIGELGAAGTPIHALAGHSFGGKVVAATRALVAVEQTWLLDSNPGARTQYLTDPDNSVIRVLELLERLPKTWAKRDDFVAAVIAEGQDPGLAQWLAMNVVPDTAGELTLRLDTAALRELLTDFATFDLWPSVIDPDHGRVEIVVAERARVFTAEDRERLAQLPAHVHVHRLEAGHWLHIEAAGAVVDLLAAELP